MFLLPVDCTCVVSGTRYQVPCCSGTMVPGSSGEVSRMNDDNGTYIPGTGTGGNMLWYQGT